MTALRATAYVLTSLASVAFLVLVGFGAAQYLRFPDAPPPLGPVASDDARPVAGCAAGPSEVCPASSPQPVGSGAP